MIDIALVIGRACAADLDLLMLGALLHDIGKLEAYQWQTGFVITEAGRLIGHVVLGGLMVARRIEAESPTIASVDETALLLHLILSHHGRLEHGAPVTPMTLEAEVLHYADDASARSCSMATALASADNFDGDARVSRPLWQLDRRRAYRGRSEWRDMA